LVISIVNSILNGIVFNDEDQDKDRIIYQ
jgi:hypothetical protein